MKQDRIQYKPAVTDGYALKPDFEGIYAPRAKIKSEEFTAAYRRWLARRGLRHDTLKDQIHMMFES